MSGSAKKQGPSRREIVDFLEHGPSKPDTHCLTILTTADWEEVLWGIINGFKNELKVFTRSQEIEQLINGKTKHGLLLETNRNLVTRPKDIGFGAKCLIVHEWEMSVERHPDDNKQIQFITYSNLLITKAGVWLWWEARYTVNIKNEGEKKEDWLMVATKSDFTILDGNKLIEAIHKKIRHLPHHDKPLHAAHDLMFGIADLIGNSRVDKQDDIYELDNLAERLTQITDRAGMRLGDFANRKRQY